MSLAKTAQLNIEELLAPAATEPVEEIALEIEEPKHDEGSFMLSKIPGAEDESEIEVVDDPSDLEVSEPETVEVAESDPWHWQAKGLGGFLGWIKERMENVPKHSGKDTTGLEKAIAYFEAIDREISKAMRADYKDEIDSSKAEEARAEIESGLERLVERLEKVKGSKFKRHNKKKKADADHELIKNAQKIAGISGIVVTVPLLISRCAKVCINGCVSAGKDLEDLYDSQVKLYKLSMREQAELQDLLECMGFQILRDRGIAPNEGQLRSSEDGKDWAVNYPG